jgi:four helix bundle protein
MAANYRAACRSKSPADFISKMGTVVEETDETLFWLELLVQANLLTLEMAQPLVQEATELLRIFSKSLSTAKHNL